MSSEAGDTPTPDEATAPRRHRAARWAGGGAVGLLALLAVLLTAVLVLVATNPGLEVVRRLGVPIANGFLTGELTVGRISGSLLSELTIEDATLTDDEGREAIGLRRLYLSWSPSALVDGAIVVDELRLDAPVVHLVQTATGGLNLARLVPPSTEPDPPEPPSDGPLDLPRIVLRTAALSAGRVDFVADGEPLADVEALAFTLTATASGARVEAQLDPLTAAVQGGLPLDLRLRAVLDEDRLTVDDLRLALEEARVLVPQFTTVLPPGGLDGRAELRVPARLVRRLGGPEDLLADVDLRLSANREAERPRWTARLDGRLGSAPIALSATVTESLDELKVRLRARSVDPSRLWKGLPTGLLTLSVDGGGDPSAPDLRAKVGLRGRVRPDPSVPSVTVRPLDLTARWRGDTATVNALGQVGGAKLDLDAALSRLTSGTPRIDRGRVAVDVPDLKALVGRAAGGQVSLTATVAGPIDAIAASGRLQAAKLTAGPEVSVASVEGDWDLTGVPSAPDGHARLRVGAVALPGRKLDGARVRLHAATRKGTARIDLARLEIDAGDLVWRGEGASLTRSPSGALDLDGLGLRSEAGGLTVDAQVEAPGPARGPIEADVRLDELALGRIPRTLVPELAEFEGTIDGRVTAQRKGRRVDVDLDLDLGGFRLAPDRPALEGEVTARLRPNDLTAKMDLRGLGEKLTLDADIPAPRATTDPAAWRRALRGGPVRRLQLDVRGLDLGVVQRFAGLEPEVEGLVSVSAAVEESGGTATLDLSTRNLTFGPPLERAEAGLEAHLRYADARAELTGRVEGAPLGFGTFTATVAGPASVFDAEAWSRFDEQSVNGARIDFERLRLAALAELGLVDGVAGEMSIRVDAGPRARPISALIRAQGVRVPWVEGTWGTELDAKMTSTEAQTTLRVDLDASEVIEGVVSAPLPLANLIRAEVSELSKVPLDARVKIKGLPLERLVKAAGVDPDLVRGRIELDVDAQGPAGDLEGKLAFAVKNLVMAERKYEDLTVDGTLDGRAFTARARFAASGAGGLTAEANGTLAETGVEADAHLTGDGLPIRFLSRLGLTPLGLDGGLHADTRVEVRPGRITPDGWLELRKLRVVFAQAALQPLYDGLLRVDLAPNEGRVNFDAKSMGGTISAKARAGLEDPTRPKLTATAVLDKFPVSAGQMARVDLKADVEGQIDPVAGTRIDVMLHDGFVTLPDESTRSLHPITSPDEVKFVDRLRIRKKTATSTAPQGAPVVVKINLRRPIDVRGGPVDARLNLDLTSRSNVTEKDGLRGRIWIPEGTVELVGRDYRVDRAEIIMEGRKPPNPRIDIRLIHDFTDVGLEFIVRVTGYADNPKVEFASSPSRYSDAELLQIFTGTQPADLGRDDGRSAQDKAAGAAVGFLAGQIQKELGKALPLDTLEVDVTEGGVSNVTLGKWITREVFLAYRQNFEALPNENEQEAVVQYRFLPGWMVELVVGLVRNDLDLLWLKRF